MLATAKKQPALAVLLPDLTTKSESHGSFGEGRLLSLFAVGSAYQAAVSLCFLTADPARHNSKYTVVPFASLVQPYFAP